MTKPPAEEPPAKEPVPEEKAVDELPAKEPPAKEPVPEEKGLEEPPAEEPVPPVKEPEPAEEPIAEEKGVEEPPAEKPVAEKKAAVKHEGIEFEVALKNFTIDDLDPPRRAVYQRVLEGCTGVCSKCRWKSGCVRCDAGKASRYYVRLTLGMSLEDAKPAKKKPVKGGGFEALVRCCL